MKEKAEMDSAIRAREAKYLEKAPLDIDIVQKSNLRSAEKDGWNVDVWSGGRLVLGFSFGVRVFKKDCTTPPETTIILALRRLDGVGSPLRIKFRPELRETAIPGGYSEVIIREDGTSVESNEKFKGSPGVWERIIIHPVTREDLEGFMEGNKISNSFVLDTTVSLKGGPTLELRGLRFRFGTRLN
ncbi:MAG: hypothetical protein HY040_22220 [Planctomycetes bacterium]|nr:hypothetical protein [Planctomycetota bacterium]